MLGLGVLMGERLLLGLLSNLHKIQPQPLIVPPSIPTRLRGLRDHVSRSRTKLLRHHGIESERLQEIEEQANLARHESVLRHLAHLLVLTKIMRHWI